jgi:predicted short-subunit dehydrogenase-like oxidoreductase (DUF2520 family)
MKIGIIGSGKIAKVIAKACIQQQLEIACIYSRNFEHASILAAQINCQNVVAQISAIPQNLDLYCLCVNDDAIEEVSLQLQVNGVVVHFSGSQPIELLSNQEKYGVCWPIQTFSEGTIESLKEIPFLIQANNTETLKQIKEFVSKLSNSIIISNNQERRYYHLAATIANNFSNHLYTHAANLLQKHQLDFKLLLPILNETIHKLETGHPYQNQTGPALRNDTQTIQAHLDLLENEPDTKALYQLMTQSIQKVHAKI